MDLANQIKRQIGTYAAWHCRWKEFHGAVYSHLLQYGEAKFTMPQL